MLSSSPATFWLNEPSPLPIAILVSFVVGLAVLANTIPLSVTGAPPILKTVPPRVTLLQVKIISGAVVNVAANTGVACAVTELLWLSPA